MVKVTNDCKSFIENEEGELYIYGAGNAGFWTGYYLDKCNIPYVGFIDKQEECHGALFGNHPVYKYTFLGQGPWKKIRIIISPKVYKEILGEILWYDHLWDINVLCLIPQYKSLNYNEEVYNINKMLGYFRRRLFEGNIPTIISNTCVAGHIYDNLCMPMASPTINVSIAYNDYINFCKNLKHYTESELELVGWERECRMDCRDEPHLVGRIDDIKIGFAHIDNENGIKERWKLLVDRINWNRIVYIMEEQKYRRPISRPEYDSFMEIEGKKLVIQTKNNYGNNNSSIFTDSIFLMVREQPVLENYFDIISWFNGN